MYFLQLARVERIDWLVRLLNFEVIVLSLSCYDTKLLYYKGIYHIDQAGQLLDAIVVGYCSIVCV